MKAIGTLHGRLTFMDDPINGPATFVPAKIGFREKGEYIACLAREVELVDGNFSVELTVGICYTLICAGGKVQVKLNEPGVFELKTFPKPPKGVIT